MKKYNIGIDIGKTYSKIVCIDYNDTILFKRRVISNLCSKKEFFDFLFDLVKSAELELSYKCECLGICFPGLVDFGKQQFLRIPTFPNLSSISTIDLANVLKIHKDQIVIDNDCNAAAFCEHKLGNLRYKKNAVLISFGTGIGAGLIIDGRVYRGTSGLSGEIGHSIFYENSRKCRCGNIGCYETLIPDYEIIMHPNKFFSNEYVSLFFNAIGNLIGTIINLLNIECAALYGFPFNHECFKSRMIECISKYTAIDNLRDCIFVDCKLREWAGAVGIASLLHETRE